MSDSSSATPLPPYLLQAEINRLRKRVNARRLARYVQEFADLPSRHILHSGNSYAVDLLYDEFEQINPRFEREKRSFKHEGNTLHNIEATLSGQGAAAKEIVIVSAHLDCTAEGDPAYQPRIDLAPGADDDGSGVAGVLLAARAITRLVAKFGDKDRRTIRFVLFNAEEAQQLGSHQYALLHSRDVEAVFQMDMIAYPSRRNIFEIHAGYYEAAGASIMDVQHRSLKLAEYIRLLVPQVSPGLTTEIFPVADERDPAQGFSDHTSFHREEIAACLISENFFAEPGVAGLDEPNTFHHLPQDQPDKLDYVYAANIARAVTAAAWYRATRDDPPCDKEASD